MSTRAGGKNDGAALVASAACQIGVWSLSNPDEVAARRIAKELGNLPPAISQAGAYIKQISGSFAKYITHYDEYRSRVNSWISKGPQPYSHSVATTWIMSFNEIAKNSPWAADLFRLLAFFNP